MAPADPVAHVSDRFWPAEKARNRTTGQSLAVARNRTEAHGGTVTVTSTPGDGATFRVRLPG